MICVEKEITCFEEELLRFAFQLTLNKHDAEDLLQDTYMKAFSYKNSFKGEKKGFRSWMYRIMKNAFVDSYRKNGKIEIGIYADLPVEDVVSPAHSSLLDDLGFLIGSLDEKYKTPLVMYSEGYKYREISDKLGICQGTVKARVFRARKDLRDLMDIFF